MKESILKKIALCIALTASAWALSACSFPAKDSSEQSGLQSTEQYASEEESLSEDSSSEDSSSGALENSGSQEESSSSLIPPRDENELPVLPLP